jgi:acyl carrier protein
MTRDEVLSTLRDVAVETLSVDADAVTDAATFKDDLGADSLDLVEVVMALEEKLDISIPEEDLADIKTVGQAVDVVMAKLSASA